MGYRNYIARIKKDEYEKIKNFTKDELYVHKGEDINNGYIGVYDVSEEKALYELGKYCEFGDKKFFKPVFLNEQLQADFEEGHDFFIVGKEFVAHVIQGYKEKVAGFYKELIQEITNEQVSFKEIPQEIAIKLFHHVHGNSTEWLQMTPYNLENGDEVTTSWKYEYAIFELVRIYKAFDWENDIMIYYGY